MAAKLFQTILSKMEGTVDTLVGVADGEGQVIACTDLSRIGGEPMSLPAVGGYAFAVAKQNGMTFRAVGDDVHPEYVLFVGGVDAAAEKLAGVLAISLGSVREFYNENCSRADFLKNVVLDNIQPTDIGQKAKELRFLGERDRVAILLRLQETVTLASVDLIQSLFSERQKDFVINMNEHDILLIKEVSNGVESEHLEQLALSMSALLEGDLYLHCTAGIGTVVGDLKELSRSYKEAQIAIEVDTGCEVIMGSTRMKAGTAQKLVMNMLSTAVMIRLGRTCDNLMVCLHAKNEKLVNRVARLYREATGEGDPLRAEEALCAAHGRLDVAILMQKTGASFDEACSAMDEHGNFGQALLKLTGATC